MSFIILLSFKKNVVPSNFKMCFLLYLHLINAHENLFDYI